jgi:hypothetical protein
MQTKSLGILFLTGSVFFTSGAWSIYSGLNFFVPAISSLVGLLCFWFAYREWADGKKRSLEIQQIKRYGNSVFAKVVGAVPDDSVQVNGKGRYYIQTSYLDPQTQELYTFNSDPIWELPQPLPPELQVYIHPNNKSLYYVEISSQRPLKSIF